MRPGLFILLLAVGLAGAACGTAPSPVRAIRPLLIYYGWVPSGRAAFRRMAAAMAAYPVVVLGSGEEWTGVQSNHLEVGRMIATDRRTAFYGYVNLGVAGGQPDHPLAYVERALRAWRAMGVRGVLLDCAGRDYGVSRLRLGAAVRAAHALSLRVLVNAWDPADVVHAGLRPGDAWLAENLVVADGRPQPHGAADWAALHMLRAGKIEIWMTATDASPPDRAWIQTWMPRTAARVGGSLIGASGPEYSTRSNAIVPASWIKAALGS